MLQVAWCSLLPRSISRWRAQPYKPSDFEPHLHLRAPRNVPQKSNSLVFHRMRMEIETKWCNAIVISMLKLGIFLFNSFPLFCFNSLKNGVSSLPWHSCIYYWIFSTISTFLIPSPDFQWEYYWSLSTQYLRGLWVYGHPFRKASNTHSDSLL